MNHVTCRMVCEVVEQAYDLSRSDLYARDHVTAVVPRHISWHLARSLTERSFPEIGRLMGGYHHTTIMHGCEKVEAALTEDPMLARDYSALREAITTLSEAVERSSRLQLIFRDHDAVSVAGRIVNPAIRYELPSVEEVEALAASVMHYAATVDALEADNEKLRGQLSDMRSSQRSATDQQRQRLCAAADAARAWQRLQVARRSAAEGEAQTAFEAAMNTLSPLFAKEN